MTDILNVKVNGEWVGIPAIKGENGEGVPTGGTTGQVLTKKTNADYDTEWQTFDALPSQTGQSGKYLTTDGSSASWGSISIPQVNNATLTITQGGTSKGTFTANASSDATIAIDNPSWGTITGTLSDQTDLNNALSGKVNTTDCSQIYPVVETYQSGSSWYRIYSDGWCEQGGRYSIATTGSGTITFLKTFANTNYSIFCNKTSSDSSTWNVMFDATTNWTTTSVTIKSNLTGYNLIGSWEAKGYLEEGEY